MKHIAYLGIQYGEVSKVSYQEEVPTSSDAFFPLKVSAYVMRLEETVN
jgi:hypothetical protein